jgi:hypothetical protein
MADLRTAAEIADDRFWDRDIMADEATDLRHPDRVDALTLAALLAAIGTLAGAIYDPSTMAVPAVAMFALFVVILFGGRCDIDN